MSILNENDAQKVDVAPTTATGLRVRLENSDGVQAGRILLSAILPHGDNTTLTEAADGTLSIVGQAPTPVSTTPTLAGLQVLLANGQYMSGTALQALLGTGNTASTPTQTATTLLAFAGPAGAPTGNAAMTGLVGSITGYGLDGSGHLQLAGTSGFGVFAGLGAVQDGLYTVNFASGQGSLGILPIVRASGSGSTAAFIYGGWDGSKWGLYEFTNGAFAQVYGGTPAAHFSGPAPVNSMGIDIQGNTVTLYGDGVAVGSYTGSDLILTSGQFGFYMGGATPGALLSSVTYSTP